MEKEKKIYVYADFLAYNNELIGTIYVSQVRGKEYYSFEYNKEWLEKASLYLDPDLQLYSGRQYLLDDKNIFGVFADSCPDRWGRRLMNRREEYIARKNNVKPKLLLESDYLLGVYDESRMGGLRFKTEEHGDYLSNDKDFATPPWTSLRELEQASIKFENENGLENDKWLKQLLAPGSSLGGARPKATVVAPDGSLWIAKFPSKNDDFNIGAWEMVVHNLAVMCGLNVPEAKSENFSKLGTTFLVKRFDRDKNKRIHFSSAMSLLGKKDGDNSSNGGSYLDIVSFITSNGVQPNIDLLELFKRIAFSMLVSNTDDHFRNHGFLLTEKGWTLSPLYDVNPDLYGNYLSLNYDENSSEIDLNKLIECSKYYYISELKAIEIVEEMKNIINKSWKNEAKNQGISRNEIERMSSAFSLAE